jgi:hypothetical protein
MWFEAAPVRTTPALSPSNLLAFVMTTASAKFGATIDALHSWVWTAWMAQRHLLTSFHQPLRQFDNAFGTPEKKLNIGVMKIGGERSVGKARWT